MVPVPFDLLRFAIDPYESSLGDEPAQKVESACSPILAIAWFLAFLYPAFATASIYLCWLAAWWTLGHRPRPSVDDPKLIGGLVDVIYPISFLMFFTFPLVGISVFFFAMLCPIRSIRRSRIASGVIVLASFVLYFGSIMLMRRDPGDVLFWWFD